MPVKNKQGTIMTSKKDKSKDEKKMRIYMNLPDTNSRAEIFKANANLEFNTGDHQN